MFPALPARSSGSAVEVTPPGRTVGDAPGRSVAGPTAARDAGVGDAPGRSVAGPTAARDARPARRRPARRLAGGLVLAAALPLALAACSSSPSASRAPTGPPATSPDVTPVVTPGITPVVTPGITPVPTAAGMLVYFTDTRRFEAGAEPYEVAVDRPATDAPDDVARARAVLDAFFAGPTPEEQARGLAAVTSGFTGVGDIRIEDGVAHVRLVGPCSSGGSTLTVASALRANLLQFPGIAWVKIYDEAGETEEPAGQRDSIPFCLEP